MNNSPQGALRGRHIGIEFVGLPLKREGGDPTKNFGRLNMWRAGNDDVRPGASTYNEMITSTMLSRIARHCYGSGDLVRSEVPNGQALFRAHDDLYVRAWKRRQLPS